MATGRILPNFFMNNQQKLAKGIWPWTQGLKSRVPDHYKKRFIEKHMKKPIPVHYRPDTEKYKVDEYGVRTCVDTVPIPVVYPPEADLGLWGGEGFVVGFAKKKNLARKPTFAKMWKPRLFNKILYSEILDRWMDITVTSRTMELIDEAFGFDFYILKTHEVDLKSKLGMKLKREMLRSLGKKSMYPDDPEKNSRIYEKYKEFIIPEEEVDWVGLSISQAENKQARLEAEKAANPTPLKQTYMLNLLQKIKEKNLDKIDK